jgi:hypothetical protein
LIDDDATSNTHFEEKEINQNDETTTSTSTTTTATSTTTTMTTITTTTTTTTTFALSRYTGITVAASLGNGRLGNQVSFLLQKLEFISAQMQ